MSDDLEFTATISRALVPGGPLSDLSIEVPGAYETARAGWEVGQTTWRRETATSSQVAGAALIHAVKDMQTGRLSVVAKATSIALLATRVAALTTAFEQRTYVLTFEVEGTEFSYDCWCADWSAGAAGVIDENELRVNQQTMTFLWPRLPIPRSGPF